MQKEHGHHPQKTDQPDTPAPPAWDGFIDATHHANVVGQMDPKYQALNRQISYYNTRNGYTLDMRVNKDLWDQVLSDGYMTNSRGERVPLADIMAATMNSGVLSPP